jgi:hypothetical protein
MSKRVRALSNALSGCLATALGLTVSGQAPRGPITPHTYPLDDEHFVRFPQPPGEQAYARIEGPHLKQYVNEITAISRKRRDDGNQYWGRISGTTYDDMAEAWVEGKFKGFGFQNIRRAICSENASDSTIGCGTRDS